VPARAEEDERTAYTVTGSEMQNEGVIRRREARDGEEVALEKGLQVREGPEPLVCWRGAAIQLRIALVPKRGVAQDLVVCCHGGEDETRPWPS
jgi:hypothetical protein